MRLAAFLEVHAEAEEQLFYPELLRVGKGAGGKPTAKDETEDAIHDNNDIRYAVTAVAAHEVGTKIGSTRSPGRMKPTAIISARSNAKASRTFGATQRSKSDTT